MPFEIKHFDQLYPATIALNIFLIIILIMIFLDKNNTKIHGYYVVSMYFFCFVMAFFITIAEGLIADEFGMGGNIVYSLLVFFLSLLNPIVYMLKDNNRKKQ